MSLKVVPYTGVTRLDIDCDTVLEGGKGKLSQVLVIGFDYEGELHVASSKGHERDVLWLMKLVEHKLMNGDYE